MKTTAEKKLAALRKKIDKADKLLLKALSLRMKTVIQIGKVKKAHRIPIVQKTRWSQAMKGRLQLAKKLGLDARFTDDIFQRLQKEAIRLQKKLLSS